MPFRLHVEVPRQPGLWSLRVGLVLEHVRWFGMTEPACIEVVRQRRVAVVSGCSPFRHVGDDAVVAAHIHALARRAPGVSPVLFGEQPCALSHRFGTSVSLSIHDALNPTGRTDDGTVARLAMLGRGLALVWRARGPGRRLRGTAPARTFLDDLERCDGLIAASAGGLTSRWWREVLWPHIFTLLAARALGLPTVVSGVTVGPFERRGDAVLAAAAFRTTESVVVRDLAASPRELRRLGLLRRGVTAPDPAVVLPPASADDVRLALRRAGVDPAQPYVALALGGPVAEEAVDVLAELLRSPPVAARQLLFLPMVEGSGDDDLRLLDRLRESVPAVIRVPTPLPTDAVLAGMAAGASLAIGTRYHLAVFAGAAGVPCVGLYAGAYTERRFRGLVSLWGDLVLPRALPGDAAELAATCAAALQGAYVAPERPTTLPGVEALCAAMEQAQPRREEVVRKAP